MRACAHCKPFFFYLTHTCYYVSRHPHGLCAGRKGCRHHHSDAVGDAHPLVITCSASSSALLKRFSRVGVAFSPRYMRVVLQSGLFQHQHDDTEYIKWPLAFVVAVLQDDWWCKRNMARASEFGLDEVAGRRKANRDPRAACGPCAVS